MVDLIVDSEISTGDLAQLEQDIKAAGSARLTQKPAKQERQVQQRQDSPVDEDADLPDKYRGKSKKEIADMHRNLETAFGRQANDLGTQRHMTDVLLGLKRDRDLQQNSQAAKPDVTGDELLANPTEALERFNAPRERENQKRLNELEQQVKAQAFVSRHPDYQQYTNNDDFSQWVGASAIRSKAAAAARNGDWEAGTDLLTEYKAHKATVSRSDKNDDAENAEEGSNEPLRAAKAASLESSSQGNSSAKKGGKVYKRADVMRLMVTKPDVYYSEEFQREIVPAYNEGRVR